jgi:hypothetical protein
MLGRMSEMGHRTDPRSPACAAWWLFLLLHGHWHLTDHRAGLSGRLNSFPAKAPAGNAKLVIVNSA